MSSSDEEQLQSDPPLSVDPEFMSSSDEEQLQSDPPLSVDPEVATFTESGGKSEHMLVNLGDKHLAVKVRCSNNNLYRVKPVYQVVETGQCRSLIVTRGVGESGSDDDEERYSSVHNHIITWFSFSSTAMKYINYSSFTQLIYTTKVSLSDERSTTISA
ncbi:MSP domain protein [Dictyocaulus viviparus]|uniref:Major sperm protein n=1 Tax=Dictyocaulus viviparus TaxID=29172 RepID=A0A0D8XFY8_DICVI|nr:MSP domain protein [Dictyocaulus viviparus]